MLTNYVFMTPIRPKCTDEVIKVYVKSVYSTCGGSRYILSDRGSEWNSN